MSYKKLGEYIQVIDNRNRELLDLPLLGVSVQKIFIPSIANTVGTDMSKYKILSKNQFTYIPDTSRRGDKIGVALLKNHEKALVSQAYTTFKIIDEEELNPDYLMMWFSRPEFDRYARYHSIGSVREVFDWSDLCDVELPIPSIEKQREIVAQYQAVANKIKVNEAICSTLEATAQALYKHWFVDFEFRNKEGQPYKFSGGDMVFNEELEKEIPEGWEVKSLSEIATFKNGLAMQNFSSNDLTTSLGVIKIRELGIGNIDGNSDRCIVDIPKEVIIDNGDMIFSWSGTLKIDLWSGDKAGLNQHLFKVTSKEFPKWYYYYGSKFHLEEFIRIADSNKTSLGHIKKEHLENAFVFVPDKELLRELNLYIEEKFKYILNIKNQNQKLTQLQSLLLSRLATLEG